MTIHFSLKVPKCCHSIISTIYVKNKTIKSCNSIINKIYLKIKKKVKVPKCSSLSLGRSLLIPYKLVLSWFQLGKLGAGLQVVQLELEGRRLVCCVKKPICKSSILTQSFFRDIYICCHLATPISSAQCDAKRELYYT